MNTVFLTSNAIIKISKINFDKYVANENDFIDWKFKNKRNIYYIMVDEMLSLENFNKIEKININKIKKNYESLDAKVISSILSTAPETILNYLNILTLRNTNEIDQSIDHYYFLVKYLFNNTKKSKLLNIFEKNEYEIFFIGNQWLNCNNLNPKNCLKFERDKKKFFNLYLFKNFLYLTPLKDFTLFLRKSFDNSNILLISEKNAFYDNDAINKLIKNFSDLNEKKFFLFAHHLSPHDPWVFNRDCTYNGKNLTFDDKANFEMLIQKSLTGYKDAYFCTLKKIESLLHTIKTNDPESILLVLSDTALNPKQNNLFIEKYPEISETYDQIFALVRFPKICKIFENNNKNNLDLLLNSLKCATY